MMIDVDGKLMTMDEMMKGFEEYIKSAPERYKKYLAVDYSEPTLRKLVDIEFNSNNDWNREWQIYTFLKNHCGINSVWFENDEYEKRMDVICKIAGV